MPPSLATIPFIGLLGRVMGKSPPLADFSIEDLVEIGRHFILAMDQRPVTLVGNCMGGIIAMELIRRYPGIVKQLVLIEIYAFMPWYLHLLLIPI